MPIDNRCDVCACIHEADVNCPASFDENTPVWKGYGLDPYGTSAYGAPTDVLPVVKRGVFGIISGYKLKWQNDRSQPFGLGERVYVYSSAENKAFKAGECTTGYYFTIKNLKIADLGAFVDTKRIVDDLGASVNVLSPAFEYGKELTLVLNASDYAGNKMEPFVFTFVVEEEN